MKKRLFAMFLCLILMFALLPTTVSAVSTIEFTTQPAPNTTVKAGSISGSLTAEAVVAPPSEGLTTALRWYECGDDGFISGPLLSTSTTLTIPATLSKGTYYFICTATCSEASPSYVTSRIAKVTVLGSDAETVTMPTFSPAGGTYTAAQSVTISCETSGVTIYYTDDGSEPTESSRVYSGAISVSSTTTLKAKAFRDDMMASETASATYTITPPEPEYSISVLPTANGSVAVDKTVAQQGDTITLTITPDEDYQLKEIHVLDRAGQDLRVEIGLVITNNSFQMPAMDVSVQVDFEKIIPPAPTVTSVAVNPASVSIQKGGTQSFNATVTGENSPAQTVLWTVEGGVAGTGIDEGGNLTIAANETAETVTVKATSTVNTEVFGTAMVTVTTPPDPEPVEYDIIEGQDGVWTKGGKDGLRFTANGDSDTFTGVAVDGSTLSSDKYTAESGSTAVTLNAAYLETLSVGQHTLRVSFTDGYADAHFTINAATPPVLPKTGDNMQYMLWLGLALLSGATLAASIFYSRKKRFNR